jgi:hypothetical protein
MSRLRRLVVLVPFAVIIGFYFFLGHHASNPASTGSQMGSALPATPAAPVAIGSPATSPAPRVATDYGRLPLYFIENRGQADRRVQYYVKGGGGTTFFTKDEVVLALPGKNPSSFPLAKGVRSDALKGLPSAADPTAKAGPPAPQDVHQQPKTAKQQPSVVRLKPVGLKKGVKLAGLHQTGHRVNYFRGKDPKKWRTDIPTYEAVVYENAYAGIDLKFYGQGRHLEYDIVVKPGADPNQVKFAYQGVQKLEVTPAGDLALVLPDGGRLLQKKPVAYQEIAGQRLPVEGKYRLSRRGAQVTCGFALAAYNKTRPLVIDPELVFSTYLGGSESDAALALAVDQESNVYIGGNTISDNFPLSPPPEQPISGYVGLTGKTDAFVTKINPSGTALIYSTYLGGDRDDVIGGIAVDGAGVAYVAGGTFSANFPTVNALQKNLQPWGQDGFVAKINAQGNALLYSTYLGTGYDDEARAIAVDTSGNAYVTGRTGSGGFPSTTPPPPPPLLPWRGSTDAFVTKISPDGSAILFTAYLGGGNTDIGEGIAFSNGYVYIVGQTSSANFPLKNQFSIYKGLGDGFVIKMPADGQAFENWVYSSYLGGSGFDAATAVAADAAGAAYITGKTNSTDFPNNGAAYPALKGFTDAFVTKIAPGGSIAWSTYLGGTEASGFEAGYGIAVENVRGSVYVTGINESADFPVRDPLYTWKKLGDAFVTRFDFSGKLLFSTYFGGSQQDEGRAIGIDKQGNVYVTGYTHSTFDIPLKNPLYTHKGIADVFVSKISVSPAEAKIGMIIDLLLFD